MATTITCDICNKTLAGRPEKMSIVHENSGTHAEVNLDLCSRCGSAVRGTGELGRYRINADLMAALGVAIEDLRNERLERRGVR